MHDPLSTLLKMIDVAPYHSVVFMDLKGSFYALLNLMSNGFSRKNHEKTSLSFWLSPVAKLPLPSCHNDQ